MVYGYLRDPPEKVAAAKDISVLLAALPPGTPGDVDLRPYCTDTDQFNASACAGNATADSVEILNAIAGYKPVQLSRMFVYAMARIEENMLDRDEGTHISACFDSLARFGICDEYIWPYDTQKVLVSPSLKAMRQALGHKIHSYYRISSTGQDRVNDILAALRAKHPVVFGTLIDKAFQANPRSTPVGPPQGDTLGGHAMVIVGYMNGLFLVKNSWGPGWGESGYWWMTPEYLMWSETHDIWVPTLGTEFA